ncbi:MAG: RNA methyltransferase [Bacteroidia bacterium]|nr:RNA methyltransferase [Bacteroidia bacterium]MCF8446111.1 RNA methyltransferase [Bacteroidia bacterium]
MLTKADIKFVKSLADKNIRYANKLFVAEGSKSITDLLSSSLEVKTIFAIEAWFKQQPKELLQKAQCISITQKELEQMSSLRSTREVIALFSIPQFRFEPNADSGLILALDTLQDPGNLGTIIRLADWYGIQQIWCTEQTVDCFNTKVIQSTMGSMGRVQVHYGNLPDWFKQTKLPVIAADMDGKSAKEFQFPKNMILLIGNEGSGISAELQKFVSATIKIDRRGKAESLNAAVASAILVDRYFGQVLN